ncbi:MAG: triose-phosphate isomerase [Patescibacteria group bacterium]|nr:triose-phosphate isomerase [Patescibacteria group bacterium]
MKYILGNWKANKTVQEVDQWLREFKDALNADRLLRNSLDTGAIELVIFPPFPYLDRTLAALRGLKQIRVGAQTVSEKAGGAFTGEVTARMLRGIVTYVLIGHSERRSYFGETDAELAEQVQRTGEVELQPVLCIRNSQDVIHPGVRFIAFEPVEAIGTGNNMPLQTVLSRKSTFALPPGAVFIYGGSVTESSALEYLASSEIDGLLIGGASLQVSTFLAIARIAAGA